MNRQELQEKFLTIGYQRRTDSSGDSTTKNRKVMGRKGIGKLSAFSIAKTVHVITRKENDVLLSVKMEVEQIRKAIKSNVSYYLPEVEPTTENPLVGVGTVLILSDLKKRVNRSLDQHLSKRIARHFTIFSDQFRVFVNGGKVTLEDRNIYEKLEFALCYGDFDKSKFKHDQEHVVMRDNAMDSHPDYTVNGWIGLAKSSGELQSGSDNLNAISILARGKMALEDILKSYREGGLYTK